MMNRGWVCAATGSFPDALRMIMAGMKEWRSIGATWLVPLFLQILAKAHSDLRQFDDARRSIGEAIDTAEASGERWHAPDIYRTAGEIELLAPRPRRHLAKSASPFRARARNRPRATGPLLGIARGDEHGATVARPGRARRSPQTSSRRSIAGSPKSSHAGPERGQDVTREPGVLTAGVASSGGRHRRRKLDGASLPSDGCPPLREPGPMSIVRFGR